MEKHSPMLKHDHVNTLAVVCGCLELVRIDEDSCYTDRMLEGARNLLIDIFRDCLAIEEAEAAAGEGGGSDRGLGKLNVSAICGKSAGGKGEVHS